MGVVGVALIVALMLKFKVARVSVVIVCVLSRLVLGATPIGEPVNDALVDLGGWTIRSRICDGAVPAPRRPAGPHPRPAGPVSAWAVLGAWLVRRLWRLIMLTLRSPAALAMITVTTTSDRDGALFVDKGRGA